MKHFPRTGRWSSRVRDMWRVPLQSRREGHHVLSRRLFLDGDDLERRGAAGNLIEEGANDGDSTSFGCGSRDFDLDVSLALLQRDRILDADDESSCSGGVTKLVKRGDRVAFACSAEFYSHASRRVPQTTADDESAVFIGPHKDRVDLDGEAITSISSPGRGGPMKTALSSAVVWGTRRDA